MGRIHQVRQVGPPGQRPFPRAAALRLLHHQQQLRVDLVDGPPELLVQPFELDVLGREVGAARILLHQDVVGLVEDVRPDHHLLLAVVPRQKPPRRSSTIDNEGATNR